jgi:hypothetical protein
MYAVTYKNVRDSIEWHNKKLGQEYASQAEKINKRL